MEMQLKKEAISINETVMRDMSQLLVEGDIIVPDIRPDMAKVLQIDATAMVSEIISSDSTADIAGKVNLSILYVPDGDSRPVCSISTSMDFKSQVENPAINASSRCMAEADIAHVEFTMLNSRKLAVRILVEAQVKCMHENAIELISDIENDCPIEIQKDEMEVYSVVSSAHNKFSMRETLDFPSGNPSAVSVLKIDTKITDKDTRAVTGKMVVKGSVSLCTLYVSAENNIEFMEHELPFTEVIDVDGASDNSISDLDLWVCQTEFGLRADVDGDMRLLDVDLLFGVNITLMQNSKIDVISDCFCPGKMMVCERQNHKFDIMAGQGKTQHTIREIMNMPEDMPEVVTVYNIITKPYITDTVTQKGKVVVTGIVDAYALYLSDSATMPINSYKKQLDFSCTIDIDGMDESMDCEVKAEVAHAGYNLTSAGEVEVRTTLNLWAKAIKETQIPVLINAFFDEDFALPQRFGIIIYFVQPGDSLWNIAKRYHVPINALIEINKLDSPEKLQPGQQLLVPNLKIAM